MANVESKAREEAVKRYPDEVAATLGGVRHGFIEGAMWMAREKSPDAVEALEELLAAWPADSLPPHALCMKAANAINKFKH